MITVSLRFSVSCVKIESPYENRFSIYKELRTSGVAYITVLTTIVSTVYFLKYTVI